jgi:hypothetical protein
MKNLAIGLSCLAALFLCSCASVSVTGENVSSSKRVQKPTKIYVADFDTKNTAVKIAGPESKDPETFKRKVAGLLSKYLIKAIGDHVAPAVATTGITGVPRKGWLVSGEFLRINTGSRVLRAGVGLGAGGTKMETRVTVTDLSSGQQFLAFKTTGGSNAMPGLLESTGPGNVAFIILSQSMMGVTDDAARTSRMITGELNGYAIDHNWLPKEKRYSVKKLGQYQLVHEQYLHP